MFRLISECAATKIFYLQKKKKKIKKKSEKKGILIFENIINWRICFPGVDSSNNFDAVIRIKKRIKFYNYSIIRY
jgi:hypothetical protein